MMMLRHSNTHRYIILGLYFLVSLSVNNLSFCFFLHPPSCAAVIIRRILPLSTRIRTFVPRPASQNDKTRHYLLLFIIADGAIISHPSSSLCICFYLFKTLTLSLSLCFFSMPVSSLHIYSGTSRSLFFSPLPTFCTHVSSFCWLPCFHNNLRPFTRCITIFNQK